MTYKDCITCNKTFRIEGINIGMMKRTSIKPMHYSHIRGNKGHKIDSEVDCPTRLGEAYKLDFVRHVMSGFKGIWMGDYMSIFTFDLGFWELTEVQMARLLIDAQQLPI